MPRLSFRVRLFLALLLVSAIPLAVATVSGILVFYRTQDLQSANQLGAVSFTWNTLQGELNHTNFLSPGAQFATARHDSALVEYARLRNQSVAAAANLKSIYAWLLAAITIIMLFIVAITGTLLSGGLSGPLEEVLDWTRRIRRREPLPVSQSTRGPAEFATLREALRDMQSGLEQARVGELEAERLRAFSEVARRVAHEMKNPLTPIRLAVMQLSRTATPETREVLDVIAVESARLEVMAREFAELGRLPEGVAAPVDLPELLDDLLKSTVPETMARRLEVGEGVTPVTGYYDPLRRAYSNLLRNAVEACHSRGTIAVSITRIDGTIEVSVADDGPGIAFDRREVIFQPYYTEKGDGTGLGLTIVRQTLEQHKGSVTVTETPGGGATFMTRIPA